MSTRSQDERQVRKLLRMGDSLGLTIPVELLDHLRWREGQKVTVKSWGKGKLLIEDWQE